MSVQLICGVEHVEKSPLKPYSDIVCQFLDAFAIELRKDSVARNYPDVQTFAFWARKANIQKKKQEFEQRMQGRTCLGKGILFHIAPSNVPVNSMFTYAFGLLAGNANIIRLPSKQFPQVDCMCQVLNKVLNEEKYSQIRSMTSILRYDRDKEITDRYSACCNMRIIWGGDETIREIRTSPLPPRSTDITFADRYSFGIVDAMKWKRADEKEKEQLAEAFYNDTYLMDQNACSTPHLICWKNKDLSQEELDKIQKDFWEHIVVVAKRYELADIKVSEKYSMLCEQVMTNSYVGQVRQYDNLLYVCSMKELPADIITGCRGKYGLFYECELTDYGQLKVFNDEKVQTCAYYGDEPEEIKEYIAGNGFCGIDRIVPFGKTLDIDVIWDGYDLVAQMSRMIV